ncbi:MAG: phosphatidylglycerol--membrane-oligosaccharide glycerophosphotransferase [Sulfurimonas sp.]|uniref:phosphatidylglycerol--membrane-oligosaccharide glycerophosphotransferase n=1 Tax=Sulfurimonas sp. TaxID=2022749 RepID=UPI00260FF280|nr:phosphatidylglycerol--membrane-oligosaccharide glycerophosphotransferase [Sulfurimonas sp.]MDD5401026.1 phosphatidylglycerol--membrane-oligosaccharide glycerophosphotransferase [Sulfurimonas sp.]
MNMILLSIFFFIFAVVTMKYKEKHPKRIFLDATLFFLYGLFTIIYFVASYFTGAGINETIIAALNLGLGEAGFGEYLLLILGAFLAFVTLFVSAFFYHRHLSSVVAVKPQKIKAFLHNGFLILAFLTHPALNDFKNLFLTMTMEQANDFYEYYKVPNDSNDSAYKKNIIFLYAESVERTYFDTNIFPDLMPNLSKLMREKSGTEFTNIVQTSGTNYTIAGTTATQCAIPLFTTSGGNSMEGIDKFYPKAVCIGDVLKKENYYLSMLQGSSVKFSGIDKFYKTHGFDSVVGRDELLKKVKNKRYINGWGLYDDTLLDIAYKEFENLSSSKDKFALFMHTLDTHHPNGHLSNSCSKDLYMDGSNEILNTVKCADILISNFIKKVKNSKYAENTIIVVTSDHLAMRNTASDELGKSQNRRNFFVVFDPSSSEYKSVDKIGTPFDVASTVLSFLNINTDLGLGRNLREKESIYNSFDDFGKRLNQWRNDILSFWKFPKMSESFKPNFKKMFVSVGENHYTLPVLFKILENNVEPYFQFNYAWKLYEQLEHFNKDDRFLWIDECKLLNYIFDGNASDKYCAVEGVVGSKFRIQGLDLPRDYKIESLGNGLSKDYDIQKIIENINMVKNNGVRYTASINDTIVFKKEGYPSFLKNLQGISYPDKVGRWTDAQLHPSALLTFVDPLPKKFKLELVCGAYGENVGNIVKVSVGDSVREFTPQHNDPRKYLLSFENTNNANTIEIVPPKPFVLKEKLEGSDEREFGLSLVSLKIINLEDK